MKSFKEYIKEEMMPYAQTEKGFVGVDNGPVRDNINLLLANVTSCSYATPYHALEVVRKVLAPFSIFPPATNFLDGEAGHEVFEIKQFGDKMGFTNDGSVVVKNSSPYFIYFEYSLSYGGAFDIFCEIVDQDELDEILADVEDEIEDDTTTGDEKDAEDTFDTYKADNQKLDEEVKKPTGGLKKACWKGYTAVGMKKKNGRSVPNCVPVSEEQLNEISKILASKYLDKNEKSREKLASKSGLHGPGIKRTAENDKAEKKLDSRVKSMHTALSKKYGGSKVAATEEKSADTHTGALTMNGKPVVSPTATTVQPDFPPKNVPVPKPRPKNFEESKTWMKVASKVGLLPKDKEDDSKIKILDKKGFINALKKGKKQVTKEEMNPAKAGAIAAGYKGSNPAEQGSIAVKNDDARRDRKANFKVAKKLARKAMKAQIKKNK